LYACVYGCMYVCVNVHMRTLTKVLCKCLTSAGIQVCYLWHYLHLNWVKTIVAPKWADTLPNTHLEDLDLPSSPWGQVVHNELDQVCQVEPRNINCQVSEHLNKLLVNFSPCICTTGLECPTNRQRRAHII